MVYIIIFCVRYWCIIVHKYTQDLLYCTPMVHQYFVSKDCYLFPSKTFEFSTYSKLTHYCNFIKMQPIRPPTPSLWRKCVCVLHKVDICKYMKEVYTVGNTPDFWPLTGKFVNVSIYSIFTSNIVQEIHP